MYSQFGYLEIDTLLEELMYSIAALAQTRNE